MNFCSSFEEQKREKMVSQDGVEVIIQASPSLQPRFNPDLVDKWAEFQSISI